MQYLRHFYNTARLGWRRPCESPGAGSPKPRAPKRRSCPTTVNQLVTTHVTTVFFFCLLFYRCTTMAQCGMHVCSFGCVCYNAIADGASVPPPPQAGPPGAASCEAVDTRRHVFVYSWKGTSIPRTISDFSQSPSLTVDSLDTSF